MQTGSFLRQICALSHRQQHLPAYTIPVMENHPDHRCTLPADGMESRELIP
jgi:hypothetical protein